MNFSISGHHIPITESIRDYAEKKVELLSGRANNIVSIDFTLTQDQTSVNRFTLDGKVKIKNNSIVATSHANNGNEVYTMIDQVVGKLERQIRKQKGKALAGKKGNASIKYLEVADPSLI